MKKLMQLLVGLSLVGLSFSCSKQTTQFNTDLLNGNWEAVEWTKYLDGDNITFRVKEDYSKSNQEGFPSIHLASVYGSSNGLKIETTKFYHLQIRENEIINTLQERSLLMEDSKLTFFDKGGDRDYTFEAEIVELTEDFLWLKYVSQSGYTLQYKYRKI
ncbi:MAG: hypothetical protein AB8F94_07555 [Saprospiraceae bacterium]